MAGAADTSSSVLVETVARIGSKLESSGGPMAAFESSLCELQGVHMTFEALEATKIGGAVNAVRKSAVDSEVARRLANALYTGWKALADQRLTSSRATQQQLPKAGDEGTKERSSSPPPVEAKQVARPEGDREMASTTSGGVAVEATKLRVHEVSDDVSAVAVVRKPTSLRVVINTTNNAPGKAEQRRVTVVVGRTGSASNTTWQKQNGSASESKKEANCSATTTASHRGGITNAAAAAAAKRVSPPGAAPLTTAASKPPTALPPPKLAGSSSGAGNGTRKVEEEAAMVFYEARLARAWARLHKGYKEVSAARKERKIKFIDEMGKERQRPAPGRH